MGSHPASFCVSAGGDSFRSRKVSSAFSSLKVLYWIVRNGDTPSADLMQAEKLWSPWLSKRVFIPPQQSFTRLPGQELRDALNSAPWKMLRPVWTFPTIWSKLSRNDPGRTNAHGDALYEHSMTDLAYTQLVLLTERPGARIGRVPGSELSTAERTVAITLDWIDKSRRAWRNDDDFVLSLLLRSESVEWWDDVFEAMQRIGAHKTLRRLRLALDVLALPRESDAAMRELLLDEISERRKMVAAKLMWRVWDAEPLHGPLMAFVFAHVDEIPGTCSLRKLAGVP